ncbi:hypothetical protein MAHJHV51_56980 [Mycobacterium avium subsp. hominissuis]
MKDFTLNKEIATCKIDFSVWLLKNELLGCYLVVLKKFNR